MQRPALRTNNEGLRVKLYANGIYVSRSDHFVAANLQKISPVHGVNIRNREMLLSLQAYGTSNAGISRC